MFRWIQITEKEAIDLETTGALPKQSGYRYESDTGKTMVEYHVDTCDVFQRRMNEET